jgi:class 3 adenylate cyclase/tetratricopeptide (TPR) repeat protein
VPACPSCGHQNNERAKFCEECGAALEAAPAPREQRKTVTALFCDVTGSTALGESTDPEALRALLARYFERMKGILEAHGGTVEKFIGDAVMAVFGVPQVHEDDALRACRAAVEMRDALPDLDLQARIGLNTGEVVAGTEERLATGDAVNVAARLEQAAQPGEILIGEGTLELVRDAVESEPVERLELKGKAAAVAAHRLRAVLGELERAHVTRFVGRRTETELVQAAWRRASEERACQLITIVGEAGVGKSRLVAEALASIPARVVRGRCLSYGDGITYWPVVEVLKRLDALPSDETAASALQSLLGENDRTTSAEEIAWAFRKLLEEQAPLMCVFDDLQWAEDTLFDLIEHVALFSGGSPLLLVCMARPELSQRRAEWEISVRLGPLPREAVDELIPDGIGDELRERIERAAGGNPLFVQEMVAMASDSEDEVVVPPNLQALLGARLDQLATDERAVLERGAIEGEVFHRGSVQALSGNGQVTERLAALVRKALVRPDRSQLRGDDAFRFRHLLIRDAAYDALPKATRAELHERFALWLVEHGADLVELDEILGYHLEQAWQYRKELGLDPDPDLARRAKDHLVSAGRRAILRADFLAARVLLVRASALVPEDLIEWFQFELVDVEFHLNARESERMAHALAGRARLAEDELGELTARLLEAQEQMSTSPEGAYDRIQPLARELIERAEALGDDHALYYGSFALAVGCHVRGLYDTQVRHADTSAEAARRLGLRHLETATVRFGGAGRLFGSSIPMPEVLAWVETQEGAGIRDHGISITKGSSLNLLGRFDEARAVTSDLCVRLEEQGANFILGLTKGLLCTEIELLAGDPAAGVVVGEEGCSLLESAGDRGYLSTALCTLGECYYELGKLDEAYALGVKSEELGATDDMSNEERWRHLRAKVLARRGEFEEAEKLAREALAISQRAQHTDANSLETLGVVLELGGTREEAVAAYEQAVTLFDQKGIVPGAERARERLASLLELEQ